MSGRFWILTIPVANWNVPDEWNADIKYCIGQQEIGEGGYHHWQIVVGMKRTFRMRAVKNLFHNSAHLELTRSEFAHDYVQKDDTAVADTQFIYGELPLRRNNATDWISVKNNAKSGNLDEIPEDIFVRHYSSLTRIAKDYARPRFRDGIECHVFWGPTGTGKSYRAFREAEEAGLYYIKNPNVKWWDGYRNEEYVIIDEFSGFIDITYLLRWIDRYPCQVENKGGALPLCVRKFWITSNLHPDDWYPNARLNHKEALMRRLTSVSLLENPNPNEQPAQDVVD